MIIGLRSPGVKRQLPLYAGGALHQHARVSSPSDNRSLFSAAGPDAGEALHFVQVAVARPLRSLFDYQVPHGMPVPLVGARVVAPFGNSKIIGVVLGNERPGDTSRTKPLLELLDSTPALPSELIEVAQWLATYYHHPIGEVCGSLLPALARRGKPLAVASEEAWRCTTTIATADALSTIGRAARQRELYNLIAANAGSAVTTQQLKDAGFARPLLNALRDKQLIEPADRAPGPTEITVNPQGLTLTDEQQRALDALLSDQHNYATHLLYGVTGSGKTEVYLQAIARVLSTGRQVLVLIPEIALTPQTVARFRNRFGAAVALHSQISDTERQRVWLRCRDGLEPLLIGTRSAILTPFKNLGLIIVDEEHDPSFKQGDGLRYSARDLAVKRARDLNIPLLLGSATPALETLHNARSGRYKQSLLLTRPGGAELPKMRLIDIRGVRLTEGLSPELVGLIDKHIKAGNQALVFLNRRGYAPTYLCGSCQWQACCPQCEARFTLHNNPRVLRCHHCGLRAPVPATCGSCGAASLIPIGAGTQRTEEALAERFPDTNLIRVDRDTTRTAKRLEAQLDEINKGEPALLVGTQMLAKGHHFPAVTLVAILDADSGFLAADYRAPERTAALIMQVAGRAGRAERSGEVVIQSLHPTNPVLTSLIQGGFSAFADTELVHRKAGGMPPFRPIAMLRADGLSPTEPEALLRQMVSTLPEDFVATQGLQVLGPVPAPMGRVAGRFRAQTMVTATTRKVLHQALRHIVTTAPPSRHGKLSWSLDVDPYDTY